MTDTLKQRIREALAQLPSYDKRSGWIHCSEAAAQIARALEAVILEVKRKGSIAQWCPNEIRDAFMAALSDDSPSWRDSE